jgi:hypothetical protein
MTKKSKDASVKINLDLLKKVEDFIKLEKNKFRYVNKKQFVDIAVAEYLKKEGKK